MNKGAEGPRPECDECGCWIVILSINRDNQALNYRDVAWSVGIRCPAFRRLVHRVKASFLTRNDSRAGNKLASSQRRFFSKIIPRLYIMSDIYIYTQNLVFHVHKEVNSRVKIRDDDDPYQILWSFLFVHYFLDLSFWRRFNENLIRCNLILLPLSTLNFLNVINLSN